jgi:sugar lactone lactonase YvrE
MTWRRFALPDPTRERVSPVDAGGVRSTLAECPVWAPAPGILCYVDYLDPHAIAVDIRTGRTTSKPLPLRAPLGGLCRRQSGGYFVFNQDGVHLMSDELEIAASVFPAHGSFAEAPPNDVCVNAEGNIFVATADRLESRANAGLFLLSAHGAWHQLTTALTVGNGPAFSNDGATLYLADSPHRIIYSFSVDANAKLLRNRRVFATVPPTEGFPDGLAVDAAGCVWNARWGGHAIVQYSPEGCELARFDVPAQLVTSCAFGGNRLSTLFITTARDINRPDDLGGYLFKLAVDRPGPILSPATL